MTFLQTDGTDVNNKIISYLREFNRHLKKHHHPNPRGDGESSYQVMEDLTPKEEEGMAVVSCIDLVTGIHIAR